MLGYVVKIQQKILIKIIFNTNTKCFLLCDSHIKMRIEELRKLILLFDVIVSPY